jgi:hypothetical protein
MKNNLRGMLLFLLFPLAIPLFFGEMNLKASATVHRLVQILIVFGITGLAWVWVTYDHNSTLREMVDHPLAGKRITLKQITGKVEAIEELSVLHSEVMKNKPEWIKKAGSLKHDCKQVTMLHLDSQYHSTVSKN